MSLQLQGHFIRIACQISLMYFVSLQRLRKKCPGYFQVIFELEFHDKLDNSFKCLLDVSLQLQGHFIQIACQIS